MATVVSVILGVALFRDVLARRIIDVTGDTYSYALTLLAVGFTLYRKYVFINKSQSR